MSGWCYGVGARVCSLSLRLPPSPSPKPRRRLHGRVLSSSSPSPRSWSCTTAAADANAACACTRSTAGGAIDVPGNVSADDVEGFDGTAEWNIFWDPPAAKRVSMYEVCTKRGSRGSNRVAMAEVAVPYVFQPFLWVIEHLLDHTRQNDDFNFFLFFCFRPVHSGWGGTT